MPVSILVQAHVNLHPPFHASVEESATNVQCRHFSMLRCGDGQDREHGRSGHRWSSRILIERLVLLIAPSNQPGHKLLERSCCIDRSVHTRGDDTADERNAEDAGLPNPEQAPLQDAEREDEGEYAMSLKPLIS